MKNKIFLLVLSTWSTITPSSARRPIIQTPWATTSCPLILSPETQKAVMAHVASCLPTKMRDRRIIENSSLLVTQTTSNSIDFKNPHAGRVTVVKYDANLRWIGPDGEPKEFLISLPQGLIN